MRRVWVALLALACASAEAEVNPSISSAVLIGDTVRVVYRVVMPTASDGRGPITGYRTSAARLTPLPVLTVVRPDQPVGKLTDTAFVPMPRTLAPGETATGSLCVVSVRRALISTTNRCVPWSASFADLPPPPPDSVKIDSATKVVEVQLRPKNPTVVTGGTIQFCTKFTFLDNHTEDTCDASGLPVQPVRFPSPAELGWGRPQIIVLNNDGDRWKAYRQ